MSILYLVPALKHLTIAINQTWKNIVSKAKLYVFTISHFCEKARWALDYMGINYQLKIIAPGTHIQIAKRLGLKRGATPFLEVGDTVIQGSDAIIDWAETQSSMRSLTNPNIEQDIRKIESRLDEQLGVHIRRWFYSEAVLDHPNIVKPIFLKDLSIWEKCKFSIKWPVIQKRMITGMDLGVEQGLASFEIVKNEIAWLESLIKSHSYLTGEHITRADISAAALIAPIVKPKTHPTAHLINLPPRIQQQIKQLEASPVLNWVEQLYQSHRSESSDSTQPLAAK